MMEPPSGPRELSRPLSTEHIGRDGAEMDIEATVAERAALTERFGLVGIEALRATVRLQWLDGERRLRLRAHITGRVTQSCVVSLDPVENTVDESVEIFFEPVGDAETVRDVIVDSSEDAEPLVGDVLDVGEVIAEEFALSLDPYPRNPALEETPGEDGAPGGEAVPGPFQALARLKRNR